MLSFKACTIVRVAGNMPFSTAPEKTSGTTHPQTNVIKKVTTTVKMATNAKAPKHPIPISVQVRTSLMQSEATETEVLANLLLDKEFGPTKNPAPFQFNYKNS